MRGTEPWAGCRRMWFVISWDMQVGLHPLAGSFSMPALARLSCRW